MMNGSWFVRGRICGTQLTAWTPRGLRNIQTFKPYLSAELIDHGNKTLVRCTFLTRPFYVPAVTVSVVIGWGWAILWLFILGASLLTTPINGLVGVVAIANMLISALFIRMPAYCRSIAQEEQDFFIQFLRDVAAKARKAAKTQNAMSPPLLCDDNTK